MRKSKEAVMLARDSDTSGKPKSRIFLRALFALLIPIAGCDESGNGGGQNISERWYSQSQVDAGRELFQTHCAVCHGEKAEGTVNWSKLDAQGNYPPPPLDGTAHAWHHALPVLERVIAEGGVAFGGVMPGFVDRLNEEEIRSAIAYFQSQWPEDIYQQWVNINGR